MINTSSAQAVQQFFLPLLINYHFPPYRSHYFLYHFLSHFLSHPLYFNFLKPERFSHHIYKAVFAVTSHSRQHLYSPSLFSPQSPVVLPRGMTSPLFHFSVSVSHSLLLSLSFFFHLAVSHSRAGNADSRWDSVKQCHLPTPPTQKAAT